jgi:hypothetical protein
VFPQDVVPDTECDVSSTPEMTILNGFGFLNARLCVSKTLPALTMWKNGCVLKYRCYFGYTIEGVNKLTCINGTWKHETGKNPPSCKTT